jgi:hypothetical protein
MFNSELMPALPGLSLPLFAVFSTGLMLQQPGQIRNNNLKQTQAGAESAAGCPPSPSERHLRLRLVPLWRRQQGRE